MLATNKNVSFKGKIICIVLSLTLIMSMIPSSLFASKAYAGDSATATTSSQNTRITSDFGDFYFNVANSDANKSVFSEAQILDKLGMQPESSTSVQKNIEEQIKAELVKQKHSLASENLPAPEEGAQVSLTSISSIESSLSCLAPSKIINSTNWEFVTSDPGAATAETVLSILIKYASFKGTYKCVLNGDSIKAVTEIPINTDAVIGKIVLSPTGTVSNNMPVTLIQADLQLKSLAKNLNEYKASVTKVGTEPAKENATEASQLAKTNVNDENYIFVDDPVAFNMNYKDTATYKGEGLFKNPAPEGTTFSVEVTSENGEYIDASYDSDQSSLSIVAKKATEKESKVILHAIKDEVEIDTFTVTISKINKQTIDVDIANILNQSQPMRTNDSQKQFTIEKLKDQSYEIEGETVNLILSEGYSPWDEYVEVFSDKEQKQSISTDGISLSSDNYKPNFQNTNLTILPAADTEMILNVFDGDGTQKGEEEWCAINTDQSRITVKPKDEGVKIYNDGVDKPANNEDPTFVNEDKPIKISDNTGTYFVSYYICDTSGVITKNLHKNNNGVKIQYDKEKPMYNGYTVTNSVERKTGEIFTDFINNIWTFFSRDVVYADFNMIDTGSKIVDYSVTDKNGDEIGPLTKVDASTYRLEIGGEKKGTEDVNTRDWSIHAVDKAGNKLDASVCKSDDDAYQIIGNSKTPTCQESWQMYDQSKSVWEDTSVSCSFDTPTVSSNDHNYCLYIDTSDFKYTTLADTSSSVAVKIDASSEKSVTSKEYHYYDFKPCDSSDQSKAYVLDTKDTLASVEKGQWTDFTITVYPIVDIIERTAKDSSGNDMKTKTYYLHIDKDKPTLSIDWDHPASEAKNDYYFDSSRTATFTFKDHDFDETRTRIDASINNTGAGIDIKGPTSGKSPDEYIYTVAFKEQGNCTLAYECIDKAGNVCDDDIIFPDCDFVQDWTRPILNITDSSDWNPCDPVNEKDGVKYFNVDRRVLTTTFTEQYSWGENNLSRCDTLEVKKSDWADVDKKSDFEDKWDWSKEDNTHTGSIVCNSKDGHYHFTISGTDLAGNELKVKVNGQEIEGTNTYDSGKFALDTISPSISIDWNRYDAANGRYYNGPRTAYITVVERNFDSTQDYVNFDYTRVDDYDNRSQSNINNNNWTNVDEYTHKTSVTFGDEGDIDFKVYAKDLAFNGSDVTTPSFTQDWTNPTMNVAWDNNSAVNDKYYTAVRTVTLSVEEHNFSGGLINVNPIVTPGHDGTMGSAFVSGWSDSNNLHTATVSFPSQGTYSMTVEGIDLATNKLSPYSQSEFIIDWTQPQIQITGVEDRHAYKETAEPVATINDANMSSATTCNVNGLDSTPGNPYQTSPAASDAQYTYSYANPEKIPDNDGVYRIEVNAVDMAGNTSTQSLVWSLNRFGSTYVIDKDSESMVNNYVKDENKKDIKVTEINPSEIVNSLVEVTKGTFTSQLNEGDDYTTNSSGGGESWYQRDYNVSKDYFKEDSTYAVTFLSQDAAGNESSNTMENKNRDRNAKVNIKFMLDNATPNYTFNSLSDSQYGETSHFASVKLEDNSKKFTDAAVSIDGEEQKISGEQLEKDDYTIEFTLNEANTPHTVEVNATDKAGNTMDTAYKTVVVSTNPFVRWFYNTPLFIGTIVGVLLIAGGITAFIYFRRKKNLD